MIFTAFILALCTVACAVLIFIKLPRLIKKLLIKFELTTDLLATIGVWLSLSSVSASLIAALASAMSGVGISGLLHIEKKKAEEGKNK